MSFNILRKHSNSYNVEAISAHVECCVTPSASWLHCKILKTRQEKKLITIAINPLCSCLTSGRGIMGIVSAACLHVFLALFGPCSLSQSLSSP